MCISISQRVQEVTVWIKGNIWKSNFLIYRNLNLCDYPYPIDIMVQLTIIFIVNAIRNI